MTNSLGKKLILSMFTKIFVGIFRRGERLSQNLMIIVSEEGGGGSHCGKKDWDATNPIILVSCHFVQS